MATQSKKYNITFIHIPKNGGTSITSWMKKYLNANNIGGKHDTLQKIKQDHVIKEKTFCVVRNPWARSVSSYFYALGKMKYRLEKRKNGELSHKFVNHPKYQEDYLSKKISNLESGGLETYIKSLPISQLRFTKGIDYILKFENLNEDFQIIQNYTGIKIPLPHKNKSNHQSYRQYYNDDLKNYVAEKCQEEIELFNYEF